MIKKPFASRLSAVSEPESMAMAKMAMSASSDVINMTWGQPDFDTPAHVKEAAIRSIMDRKIGYTVSSGIPELREAVCALYENLYGTPYSPSDEVLIVPGAKQGLMYIMQALLDPGDEVVVLEPCWLSYKDIIQLNGGVPVSLSAGENLKPSVELVEAAISSKTKAILINNPINPSGYIYSYEELAQLAELAERHDCYLISDEIYDRIAFTQFVSLAEFSDIRERLIIVNGFSKSYAMTGWRVGYLLASAEVISRVSLVHQHSATCASAPSQFAALAAATGPQDIVKEMTRAYQSRRDLLVEGMKGAPFDLVAPAGTFYAMLRISKIPEEFCGNSEYLLKEYGIASVNGAPYGDSVSEYVRLSFCCEEDVLNKAIKKLTS